MKSLGLLMIFPFKLWVFPHGSLYLVFRLRIETNLAKKPIQNNKLWSGFSLYLSDAENPEKQGLNRRKGVALETESCSATLTLLHFSL